MSVFLDADDRVRAIHFLKKVTPADGKVVRVEGYESDIYGNGPTAFIWDPNLSAPSPDQDHRVASSVDTYGPGGANEGAWDIVPPISPIDAGVVIAVPEGNQARGIDPVNYANSDEAVNQAAQYVGNHGGGIVRLPTSVLPIDYGVVTVPSGVSLVVEEEHSLFTIDDTDSPYALTRPGNIFVDSSSAAVTLNFQEELEVNGIEVQVKRFGANTVTVGTETDATVKGSATHDLGSDGLAITFVYRRATDNWFEMGSSA